MKLEQTDGVGQILSLSPKVILFSHKKTHNNLSLFRKSSKKVICWPTYFFIFMIKLFAQA